MLVHLNPLLVGVFGAAALSAASIAWAYRVAAGGRSMAHRWTQRVAEMEAKLEKAETVLSTYRGLVLIWEDEEEADDAAWGAPRMLGGPAALASLMSFTHRSSKGVTPADRLLDAIGDLELLDGGSDAERRTLRQMVGDLRQHGVTFIGTLLTSEGRSIDVEGSIAGGLATLWLADPAARMADDNGIMGRLQQNTAELHGALAQLDNAPCLAWRRDSAGRLIWANKSYVEAVEASGCGAIIRDQIELDAAVRRLGRQVAATKESDEAQIAINVGGGRRIFHVSETPAHANDGAAINGFAVDITDLDETRTELDRHIDANQRTLDQLPTAVAMFGVSQELRYYNRAFADLWELETAELDAKPAFGDILDRLRNAGRLPEQADYRKWKGEQLALFSDSGQTEERTAAAPDDVWPIPDGRTLRIAKARHSLGGVVVVFDDITERLRFEALHNTQIKVQKATLNNLSEGVATFGADGRLKLQNDAFREMWRLDEDFLAGRPHIEQILTRIRAFTVDGTDALALVRRRVTSMTFKDRTSMTGEFLALSDGRTLSFGTEPLPDGATLLHFQDVTDSCEREKELKERNAFLEDIDRQKSKFADHVSYQLRTPLLSIIGFSEMLGQQMFGVLNERQQEYVDNVLTAAYTLKDLFSDIMDLVEIDAGKLVLEQTDIDIRDLLTNAAAYAALKAEDTQVKLSVNCPKDIGTFRGDERRMKQALFNLLSNAFAYTGTGGEVVLSADRSQGLVRIHVSDSGRGVSPNDQARAFEAFESSGPSAGAGLGLALVQRFITLHGGWVRLESSPGKGTDVSLFLPTAHPNTNIARPDTPPTKTRSLNTGSAEVDLAETQLTDTELTDTELTETTLTQTRPKTPASKRGKTRREKPPAKSAKPRRA